MSLEFGRKKSVEGLNDYDEHLEKEASEQTWHNPGQFPTYNPARARELANRVADSKKQTLEYLDKIERTLEHLDKIANSPVHEKTALPEQRKYDFDAAKNFDYGKSGVGSFAELMTKRAREQAVSQLAQEEVSRSDFNVIASRSPELAQALYSTGYDTMIESDTLRQLPSPIQKEFQKRNEDFLQELAVASESGRITQNDIISAENGVRQLGRYINSADNALYQSEKLKEVPTPKRISSQELASLDLENIWDGRHYAILNPAIARSKNIQGLSYDANDYSTTDTDGNNMWSYLACASVKHSGNNHAGVNYDQIFAYTINHLDFSNCIEESPMGGTNFNFNSDIFFNTNEQGFSPVDILIQNGDVEGLKALEKLASNMTRNRLPKDSTKNPPEFIGVDTSNEGVKLLGNLRHTILNSLSIISDEHFNTMLSYIEDDLDASIIELADANYRISNPAHKTQLENLILAKTGHSADLSIQAQSDVLEYCYPA